MSHSLVPIPPAEFSHTKQCEHAASGCSWLYNHFRVAAHIQLDHLARGQILMIMYSGYAGSVATSTKSEELIFDFFSLPPRDGRKAAAKSFQITGRGAFIIFFFQIISGRKSINDTIMMQTRLNTSWLDKQLIIHIYVSFVRHSLLAKCHRYHCATALGFPPITVCLVE